MGKVLAMQGNDGEQAAAAHVIANMFYLLEQEAAPIAKFEILQSLLKILRCSTAWGKLGAAVGIQNLLHWSKEHSNGQLSDQLLSLGGARCLLKCISKEKLNKTRVKTVNALTTLVFRNHEVDAASIKQEALDQVALNGVFVHLQALAKDLKDLQGREFQEGGFGHEWPEAYHNANDLCSFIQKQAWPAHEEYLKRCNLRRLLITIRLRSSATRSQSSDRQALRDLLAKIDICVASGQDLAVLAMMREATEFAHRINTHQLISHLCSHTFSLELFRAVVQFVG